MATITPTPLKVLFAIHPTFDTLDLAGPLETLSHAKYPNTSIPIFQSTITAVSDLTTSEQGLTITRHILISEAHATLADYDILIIPGGGIDKTRVHEGTNAGEPMKLISAFASLPKTDGKTRILFSICTGSLFLAEAGVLAGPAFKATTHPRYYGTLRELLEKKGKGEGKGTEVVETERFVVNKVDEERGLRIVTAGGVSCGLDAALWLVGDKGGKEVMEWVGWVIQHAYRDGVVL